MVRNRPRQGAARSRVSHTALIKVGQLVTLSVLLDPGSVRAGRELYQRGGLQLLQGAPLLVDHEDGRKVGSVDELLEFPDTDGDWLVARCTVTEPPEWLRQGTTKASVGLASLSRQKVGAWERVLRGLVSEVSILSPSVQPREPRARVVLLRETPAQAPERTIDTTVDTEAIVAQARADQRHPAGLLIRPGIGQVLGVR
jgi:hypothetical protein